MENTYLHDKPKWRKKQGLFVCKAPQEKFKHVKNKKNWGEFIIGQFSMYFFVFGPGNFRRR
jgi:hypothetical protein